MQGQYQNGHLNHDEPRRSIESNKGVELKEGAGGSEPDNASKANMILMKAAQRFFKESNGDEDKPVKESIRIFNSFRIRSSSPTSKKMGSVGQGNKKSTGVGGNFPPPRVVPITASGSPLSASAGRKNASKGLSNRSNHHFSSSNLQQKKRSNNKPSIYAPTTQGVSPKKRLARFKAIKDGASVLIGGDNEDEVTQSSPAPPMQVLEDINRFSASLVLSLEDSVIQEAIQNLGLKEDSLQKWIEVSDFYSIHESVRMQMRRYLTALNEMFFQIEAIIKERDRLLAIQAKNAIAEQNAAKRSPIKSPEEKSIFHAMQPSSVAGAQDVSIINTIGERNHNPRLMLNVQLDQTTQQQQQSQQKLNSSMQMQYVDGQPERNTINAIVSDISSTSAVAQITGVSPQSEVFQANVLSKGSVPGVKPGGAAVKVQAALLKCEERSKAVKKDLSARFAQQVEAEKRLTELRFQEAVTYEIVQKEFEIIDRERNEFSERLKDEVLQEKVDRIAQHNQTVQERKEAQQKLQKKEEQRRYKVILEMQAKQREAIEQKEKEIEKRNWDIQLKLKQEHQHRDDISISEEKPPEYIPRYRSREPKAAIAATTTAAAPRQAEDESNNSSSISKTKLKKNKKQEHKVVTVKVDPETPVNPVASMNTNNNSSNGSSGQKKNALPLEHRIVVKYEQNLKYQQKCKEAKEADKEVLQEMRMEKEAEFKERQKEKSKLEKKAKKELELLQHNKEAERENAIAKRMFDISNGIAKENEEKAANAMRNLEQITTNFFETKDLQMKAFKLNKESVRNEQKYFDSHQQRTIAFTIETQRSREALLVSTKSILEEVSRQEKMSLRPASDKNA